MEKIRHIFGLELLSYFRQQKNFIKKMNLFTPFVQADNSPRSDYNGTGLGMPIVETTCRKSGRNHNRLKSKLGER